MIGSDDGRLRKLQGGRQHLVEADLLFSQQYLAAFDPVYVEQIVHEAGDMVEVLPHREAHLAEVSPAIPAIQYVEAG